MIYYAELQLYVLCIYFMVYVTNCRRRRRRTSYRKPFLSQPL